MSEVKRYTLTNGLLYYVHTSEEWDLFNGMRHVVLAADYDALAAELSDWQGQASSARVVVAALNDNLDSYAERIAQLEAALAQIVTAASYRCEESVETLEAALAFIKMTAREILAPKEPT